MLSCFPLFTECCASVWLVTRSDTLAAVAFVALSAWLGLLLAGWTFGGAIHLLLALALILFPWRRLSA